MLNDIISVLFNLGLEKADEIWNNWSKEIGKYHNEWSKYIYNKDYENQVDMIKLEFTKNIVNMILQKTNIDKSFYLKTHKFDNDFDIPLSARAFHGPIIDIPEYNIKISLNNIWDEMFQGTKFVTNGIYKPEFIARQYSYFTYKTTNEVITGGLKTPVKIIETLPIIKNYII